jgi:hypothetical protein
MKGSMGTREKYNITAAEIDSGLQLSSSCLSMRCTKEIVAPILLLSSAEQDADQGVSSSLWRLWHM